ncbi:DUF5682 family protein [Arachnia propionica]|uniref:DUF5682 family protein n=1 Tax=Arachnia propionica TaxID=1750 RepID=UPI00163AD157|nr:DUF5682 family protein [Arachnia propionica]
MAILDPRAAVADLVDCRSPFLIGIRHHSPAMAVAIPALLDEHCPDVLAIELPAEANEWLHWLTHPEARAPLALAFSGRDGLAFYPFADFSPELAALRWARHHDVPVVCIDLPLAAPAPEDHTTGSGETLWQEALAHRARTTPGDVNETWDRLVEAPAPGSTPEQLRIAALAHGWASRRAAGDPDAFTAAREEWMRGMLAPHLSAGKRVVAVVGSFHAAALVDATGATTPPTDLGPEVTGSLVPYTFASLDSRSGYPAGIRDPGWQQAVVESRLDASLLRASATGAITEITRALRDASHPAGPGEAAETARVALDLATLRGLAAPSRRELIEAVTTVLAQGEVLGRGRVVAEALEQVLIGDRRGELAPGSPVSPLRQSIVTELRDARVDPDRDEEWSLTPLRGGLDLIRHILFTRLMVAGISFASPTSGTLWRGAETTATTWTTRWTAATDATIEVATAKGLSTEQIATTALLTREISDAAAVRGLLVDAAACGSTPALERALALLSPLTADLSFHAAVEVLMALSDIELSRIPGARYLSADLRERAGELRAEFTSAAVRELKGIEASDDLTDAAALAAFVELGQEHQLSLTAALTRLSTDGSPLMQGAAAGLLLDDTNASAHIAGWLDAATVPARRALRRRLSGLLVAARGRFTTAPATLALVARIGRIDDDEFVALLPSLRGGFDVLDAGARAALLDDLAGELGRSRNLVLPPEETARTARYDTAARSRLAALGLADLVFSPAERWRLILGEHRERLSPTGRRMASALDELYGRPNADSLDGAARGASNGPSQLGVRQWEQEIEALFGHGEVAEIFAEAAAAGRGDVLERLDPETTRPSVELLATALSLTGGLSEARLSRLRPLVARMVRELSAELAIRLRPALTGLAVGRPTRRRTGRLDLERTLRANLKQVVPLDGRPQVVPAHPVFRAPVAKEVDWHLIVLVDVSGSMSESVVYSALTAAILAESPALSVEFLAFSTEVLDFTGHVTDPLKLLLEVEVGGGTDIAGALRVARSRVRIPSRTLLVLISDFDEFGSVTPMLGELEALRGAGVRMLGCAALNDSGTGAYNAGIAAQAASAGMRVAAVSPLDLARWVGSVVREAS